MGKAIIIPNISFYSHNFGIVNFINSNYVLKITALEDITISFPNDLEYNTKKYPKWINYAANTQLVVLSGTTISFRGNLEPDEDNGIGTFTISGDCAVLGNPLGLLKDDLMVNYAFKKLFKNCTSILDASHLTLQSELSESCYEEMFYGCTSLTTAPKLLATELEEKCYEKMFYGCTSLERIVCYNLLDISDYVSADWVYGVANSGIFEIDYLGDWDSTNKASHIPNGWKIDDNYNKPIEDKYFTIEIIDGGKFTVLPAREQSNTVFTNDNALSISYSINGNNWIETKLLDSGLTLDVNTNDYIRFKGTNNRYCNNSGGNAHKQWYIIFGCKLPATIDGCTASFKNEFTSTTASFNVYGNIMSLCYGDNFIGQTTLPDSYTFCSLFKCSNVRSAENLILPSTTLLSSCYRAMFSWAKELTMSPALIATTPVTECYKYIFEECNHLRKIVCLANTNINTNSFECWTLNVPNNSSVLFIKNANTTISLDGGISSWRAYTGSVIVVNTGGHGTVGSNWTVQDAA